MRGALQRITKPREQVGPVDVLTKRLADHPAGVLQQFDGAGLGLALLGTRLLAGLLYGVGTTDLLTFVVVPVLLLATTLAACALPALRAARLEPIVALREE